MELLIIAIGMIVLAAFAIMANGIGRGLPRLLGRSRIARAYPSASPDRRPT